MTHLVNPFSKVSAMIDQVIKPGKLLDEYLAQTKQTQSEFATRIHVSRLTVNQIIAGKRAITIDMACRLEKATKIFAKSWLELQLHHQLTAHIKQNSGKYRNIRAKT